MRKSRIKQITLAVCLALVPISVFAAGLGKLNVSSGLGEPLKAEIELLSLTAEELSSLTAVIASEEAYAAQGIGRAYIHNNIRIELGKSFTGAPILRVRSTVPVDDPFLDMLVQVDWATGRLQREYTVLLDPPGYRAALEPSAPLQITAPTINSNQPSAPISNPQMAGNSANSATKTPSSTFPTPEKPASSAVKNLKPKTPAIETASQVDDYSQAEVTTVRGDTLSSIANRMQADGVSLDQMLMALYENNKSAFVGKNINQLKVGQIIRIPSAEQRAALTTVEASKAVRVHASNWNDYRNSLAGTVATAPALSAALEEKQTATGKIVAAEDKATPLKTGPQDVVKLSSGEKDKATSNANKAFEEKITALQEETTAREKSLLEAQERSNALEKQIQDMQKLLALKSQTMANVQNNAENTVANAKNSAEEKPAESQASTLEAAPVTEDSSTALNSDKPTTASENQASETNTAKADTPEVKPATPAVQAEPVEDELSFVDTLLESTNPLYIALGVLLLLLVGGWLYLRNKRKRDLDSFERGILTSGGLRANTVFGNTTGATGNSDTSFLTDFAQSADGSMIDTNDVDPIAEAEVYMAYGRDAQAEEILKDAITKEPTRYELHLKLLEMYASRQDGSAFEAIAGELYTTLGADNPTWAKVAAIGAVMEPNNPLYSVAASSDEGTLATQKLNASDFSAAIAADDLDLDFSTDINDGSDISVDSANNAVEASFAGASAVGQTEAFEFDATQQFKPGSFEAADTTNAVLAEKQENETDRNVSNSMDFDLGDFSFSAPALDSVDVSNVNTEASTDAEPNLDSNANALSFTQGADDFPVFDMPETATSTDADATSIESIAEENDQVAFGEFTANDIDFSFDLPEEKTDTPQADTIRLAESEIEFDLDLDMLDGKSIDDAINSLPQPESNATASEFDLSAISFDLDDTPSAVVGDIASEAESIVAQLPESEDVAIKLDLVAAYIEMDDKEGARELLEEVLKEGGLQQQKKAQDLLTRLT